jgi:raffinose/stachyose/melibiose transport system permease protein
MASRRPARAQSTAPPAPAEQASRRRRPLLSFGHWWWAIPGVVLVIAIHYVATGVGGFFAFTDWSGIGKFNFVGFDNFVKIFQDPSKIGALGNTIFLAFASVLISNVGAVLLALGTNRIVKTRLALRVLFFMPVVLSPLAVSYIWKFIFDYNGPINALLKAAGHPEMMKSWLADPSYAIWAILIVLVWQNTGFAMVIYLAGLASVPVEVEEAAAIDGATGWQRFWSVVFPALRPAVAIATTLGIVNGLRTFDQVMALTAGGPAGATETLATQVYKQAFALNNFGYGAALALLLTVIILFFAIVQQRVTREPVEES